MIGNLSDYWKRLKGEKERKIIVKEQLALGGELLNSATHALSTAAASKDLVKGGQTETSMNQNPKHICVA